MTDIKIRLAQVDHLDPPSDLWEASTTRVPGPDRPLPSGVQSGWRKAAVIAVAFTVFGAAVLFAWSVLDVEPAPPTPPPVPASDPFASLPGGWTELPAPPEIRCCSVDAWTGTELLIWGGEVGFGDESLDTGWRYDAKAGEWRPMPPSPLGARSQAAGVWTGSELLVWGGADFRTDYPYDAYDDGAAFDPATDRWRVLPPAPLDGRQPLAVWTGEEMIVWGATGRSQRRVDGAAYDPQANAWRPIADAPIELTDATASWTGEEMIVFGAALHGGNEAESRTAIGAAYDPANDSWRQIADSELDTNANTSVWSDGRLLAFDYTSGSATYDPDADRWTSTGRVPIDACEDYPLSVVAGAAYGRLCGSLVRFDPERNEWRRIDPPQKDFFPDEMFGAGSTLLVEGVVGRFGEGDDVRLFAYRDRSAASPAAPSPAPATRSNGMIAFSSGPSANILVVEQDGSSVRRLVNRHAEDQQGGVQFAWSPDGSKLAFTDYRPDGTRGLFVMDSDGGDPVDVSPGLELADGLSWSPDGAMLAFGGCCDAGYQVYAVDADGTGLRQVSKVDDDGVSGAFMPAWSPDGASLAWVLTDYDEATDAETSKIVTSDLGGGDVVEIVRSTDTLESPTYSPDGSRLAFFSKGGRAYPDLYVVRIDGDAGLEPTRLTDASIRLTSGPRWQPDSSSVVFAGQDSDDNYGLYRVDVAGSDVSILLQDAYIGSPTWSPDGAAIAFVRDDAGSGLYAISVMRPDGTGVRDLTGELDEAGSVDWQGLP
jgi:Tol biopolymer transport system component/N-acetylneuraminic acid mutarotase